MMQDRASPEFGDEANLAYMVGRSTLTTCLRSRSSDPTAFISIRVIVMSPFTCMSIAMPQRRSSGWIPCGLSAAQGTREWNLRAC